MPPPAPAKRSRGWPREPGIAETDREKIFEPFFTTKADGKGTGLGLPIVRNIVEQHRGQISVTRSDLGGAAFRVVIPIA